MSSQGVSLCWPAKDFFWIVAGFDEDTVRGFYDHAVGLKDGTLVLTREVQGDAFLARFRGHDHVLEKIWFAFDVPDGAGDGCGDFDRGHFVPAREAAVRFHCQVYVIRPWTIPFLIAYRK